MVRNISVKSLIRILILTLMISVFGGRAFGQVFNIYEGYGVLENGWQNGSNIPLSLTNGNPVYENTYSLGFAYTGANQMAQFNYPNGFNSAYLGAIELAVYEAGTSGRTINVSINVNGTQSGTVSLSNYIIGTAAANTWMPVIIPLSAFGVPAMTNETISNIQFINGTTGAQGQVYIGYFGFASWNMAAFPPVAINVNPSVQLITPTGTARTIDQKMFGVNTAVWASNFSSFTCQNLIGRAKFNAFRFPGGSLSDTYDYSVNRTLNSTYAWPTDFDQFASSPLVHDAGGQGFITVNYGTGDTIHPGHTGAQLAGQWVAYSNTTKGYKMKYWEVGNEVYGTWETDAHTWPNDPVTYANAFKQYYISMKLADPTVMVGAVAAPGEDTYGNYSNPATTPTYPNARSVVNPVTNTTHVGWTPIMLATMKQIGVTPDFIIYHRYPEYNVDCDYTLLTGNGGWAADLDGPISTGSLRAMLTDYLGTTVGNTVQIMCTENNADAGTPGKQLTSLTNALYMADSFGQVASTTEANSYMFWDLINGQGTNPADGAWLYGWRTYGDEGIFSPDFTQLYPTLFAEQLVNLFAGAGDEVVSASSSYGMLTAYATKRSDGTVRVMVINLAPNQPITASLSFSGGFHPSGTAVQYSYGVTQDNQQKQGWYPTIAYQDLSGTAISGNRYTFPAYSINVILYTPFTKAIPHPPLAVQVPKPIKP